MNSTRNRVVCVMAMLAVAGCRRQLPDGISQQSLDALIRMADEAVTQCDTLLAAPDCLSMGGFSGDPTKAVVLNATAFLNDPDIRFLSAGCAPGKNALPPKFDCESHKIDHGIDESDECANIKEFGNWPPLDSGKSGVCVYVSEKPECTTPMPTVIVRRKSPKGAMLDLHAVFISKKWLDSHPTVHLKSRPLPKRRDRLPLEQ